MSGSFRFDPVELPPECEALRVEVRTFIAEELAVGLWVPTSDFGSHRSAAFSRRRAARGWWPASRRSQNRPFGMACCQQMAVNPARPVATFGRGFAADLLQMQQGVIIHETLGCRLRQTGDTPHHLSTEPIWFSQHLRRWLCHNRASTAEHRGGYP